MADETNNGAGTATVEPPAETAPKPRRARREAPAPPAPATPAEAPADPSAGADPAEELGPLPEPSDAPPRRTRRRRSDAGKPRGARRAAAGATAAKVLGPTAIRRRLEELANLAGGLLSLVEPHDGAVILANAEPLARAWAPIAERHPRVRAALVGLESGGVYGAAAVATLTVLLPILAHHRLLPAPAAQLAGLAGVPGVRVPSPAPEPTSPAGAAGAAERVGRAVRREPPAESAPQPTPTPRPATSAASAAPSPGGVHAPPAVSASTPFPAPTPPAGG